MKAKTALAEQTQPPRVAIVLDVETTGLNPQIDEILELAMTLFRYDPMTGRVLEVVRRYSGLREPSCRIPLAASQVHGITQQTVRGRLLDYRKIHQMAGQADFVVAHNAEFDRGFVERLMPSFRSRTWLCSLYGIDWHAKGFRDRSLEGLAKAHKINISLAHRADADVETLLALLSCESREGGRSHLFQLLRDANLAA